jgi:Tol biopolymer transport system component
MAEKRLPDRLVGAFAVLCGLAAVGGAVALAVLVVHVPQRVTHWWTCNSGIDGAPTWSPDGKQIAFAAKGQCDTEIVVIGRDGRGRHLVSSAFAEWPAWSPSGDSILVVGKRGFSVIDTRSGQMTPLRNDDSDAGAAWSPDGTQIAFTHGQLPGPGGDYASTLSVMSGRGGQPRRIVGHSCDPGTPAWSPDGRSLAVGCSDGIYVFRLNGDATGRRIVKESFGFDPPKPSWSRDGKTIAFVSDEIGIDIVPSDGSSPPRTLVHSSSQQWGDAAEWSPDGHWIAYSVSFGKHADQGIYLVRSNGRDVHRVAVF